MNPPMKGTLDESFIIGGETLRSEPMNMKGADGRTRNLLKSEASPGQGSNLLKSRRPLMCKTPGRAVLVAPV